MIARQPRPKTQNNREIIAYCFILARTNCSRTSDFNKIQFGLTSFTSGQFLIVLARLANCEEKTKERQKRHSIHVQSKTHCNFFVFGKMSSNSGTTEVGFDWGIPVGIFVLRSVALYSYIYLGSWRLL